LHAVIAHGLPGIHLLQHVHCCGESPPLFRALAATWSGVDRMSGANIKELAKLVGSSVVLEVIGGSTFSGVLYSVDADSGLVALRENAIGHQADYNIVNAAHIVKFSSGPGGLASAELREHLSSKVAAVPEETLQKFYARESDQVSSQCCIRCFVA
jgi:hypothetical protein